MMTTQQEAQAILTEAVQQAEKNILDRIRTGQAKSLTDAFEALTALAIHTGFVVNGDGPIKMSMLEILQMEWFIVTVEGYKPSKDFPYTKEQMRKALEATGQ